MQQKIKLVIKNKYSGYVCLVWIKQFNKKTEKNYRIGMWQQNNVSDVQKNCLDFFTIQLKEYFENDHISLKITDIFRTISWSLMAFI